jgi:glycosyltransferase involved in cell wall biosynthesis
MRRPGGRLTAMPLPITVVIPAYNRADLVGRAVASALAQRPEPPAEVLVVDDASSDSTAAAAEQAGATVIRHEVNQGEGGARNTAFRHAAHEWVALLDSDDEWTPDHLANLWPRAAPHVVLASSAWARTADGDQWLLGGPWPAPHALRSPATILFPENPLPASGVLVKRDVVIAAGGFRPLPSAADADMWIRVLEHGTGLACPEPTLIYHVHAAQVSGDRAQMRRHYSSLGATYADRPWFSASLTERMEAVGRWDDMRALVRERRRADALRDAAWLVRSPRRLRAVSALLRSRHGVRGRAPQA